MILRGSKFVTIIVHTLVTKGLEITSCSFTTFIRVCEAPVCTATPRSWLSPVTHQLPSLAHIYQRMYTHTHTQACTRARTRAVTEPVGGMQMCRDEHNKRTKSSRSVWQRHSRTDSAAENKDPAGTPTLKHSSHVGGMVSGLRTGQEHRPQNQSACAAAQTLVFRFSPHGERVRRRQS